MKAFNIRVYGVLLHEKKLLVSDEYRFGKEMTKLPGGGLEWGEGLEEALIREWQEELNVNIEINSLIYINPFLQISAFNPNDQVLCVYFDVSVLQPQIIPVVNERHKFLYNGKEEQYFRWVSLHDLKPEEFTYPIDQSLVPHLKA